ncbi:MAG: hypothetical protein HC849_06570 [Oscillatoriales cyanobacterium RU_3_3]|nr:hypothetical protein [Oscillatoriales cyanobacterium RU_3_3]
MLPDTISLSLFVNCQQATLPSSFFLHVNCQLSTVNCQLFNGNYRNVRTAFLALLW